MGPARHDRRDRAWHCRWRAARLVARVHATNVLDRILRRHFAAGLLNQVGKGPHFAVRFGAIAFAVIAGLPALPPEAAWYFAGAAALSLVVKFIDQTINGPLPDGAPWPGSIAADWSHWFRFALAYAIAASAGLWIGVQSGSVRAVWTAVRPCSGIRRYGSRP